jgi:ABC-2 type transport system ATP-binding protein
MSNVLEVTNLNKSYVDFSLSNISFSLREDCITGFIGINGAGKTTTIRTILGLAQKTSGTIKAFGKDMGNNEMELKNRIGVVLDEGCFYDELTMAEMKNIIAPAYLRRIFCL